MSDPNQSTHFLNPDTYLNHLPSAQGFEIQIRGNIAMVLLGVALWDALAYLTIDSRIVRDSHFNLNIVSFIFARLFALGHICIVANIFPTENVDPRVLYIISSCFYMLAMMMSSFLFLQRVLAIYNESRRVRISFTIFWLITSLSDVVIPLGGSPHQIPGTKINQDAGIDPWVVTCAWLSFSFDTAVTAAISYKLWLSHRHCNPNDGLPWYHVVSGKTLPQLPRLIFTGGLQYYLIVVWAVMVAGISLGLPSVPQIYKSMFPAILILLMASMACRVFRNVKLFDSHDVFQATESL